MLSRLHPDHYQFGDTVGDDAMTTGEDIDGGVTMLRPSVDSDMALRDHDDATDSLGIEVMKIRRDDSGTTANRTILQDRFETLRRIQNRLRTIT